MTYEIYVHVPFCMRRCGYCDFNTYTARDLGGGATRKGYTSQVIAELELVKRWQEEHNIIEPPASSIFFGGGTPTILSAQDLTAIVDAIRSLWGVAENAEITTEANPDTVDQQYIELLAQSGFTRISFGMQSAVPHVLQTLDRTHTPENVVSNVKAAKQAGLQASVDLIYGTPGENLEDWRTSVETALSLNVNHVSAYALTIEPHTKMGRQIAAGLIPNPDDDDQAAKYELADAYFTQAGLQWYEVSNWAKPGYESQHNLGYWRNIDWAGVGPGAHSHYILNDEFGDVLEFENNSEASELNHKFGLRSWDIVHPRVWLQRIKAGEVPWDGHEYISEHENLEEIIMLGIRLREGLDITRLQEYARVPLSAEQFTPLVEDGLVEIRNNALVPTLRGRLLNDTIIERIFSMFQL
ncbi:MAG: radical SAM family heme chaperone HemW [Bifidobacteriaceae bacterium]|nr:radical SAM family heme chaperone HemW [Bifidobacteriaceae bacterium]